MVWTVLGFATIVSFENLSQTWNYTEIRLVFYSQLNAYKTGNGYRCVKFFLKFYAIYVFFHVSLLVG